MTKILPCVCRHDYQAKKYGKLMRVHNAGDMVWRCTVCGNEKARKI